MHIDDLKKILSGFASLVKSSVGEMIDSIRKELSESIKSNREDCMSEIAKATRHAATSDEAARIADEKIKEYGESLSVVIGGLQPKKEALNDDKISELVREQAEKNLEAFLEKLHFPGDGEPGRDGLDIEIIDLDESKSYPRGTYATWNGGLLRSLRRTDPLEESPDKSGWHVIMNGIAGIELNQIDERNFAISLRTTSGKPVEKKIRVPAIIDKGVWKSDRGYNRGDGVTYQGSFWIAQESTEDKPGSKDWRLAVKKGRDGKDGGKGEKGDPGGPGRPGKDLTQMGPRGEKW